MIQTNKLKKTVNPTRTIITHTAILYRVQQGTRREIPVMTVKCNVKNNLNIFPLFLLRYSKTVSCLTFCKRDTRVEKGDDVVIISC